MNTSTLANLEKLLGGPRDGSLLRYSIGIEYLKLNDLEQAIRFFEDALDKDPRYTAAWKNLAQAKNLNNDLDGALAAYRQGIEVATARGDVQAAKEMKVFMKRVEKRLAGSP